MTRENHFDPGPLTLDQFVSAEKLAQLMERVSDTSYNVG